MDKHGLVYWNEYNTWDPQGAMAYFGAMFGWTFHEMPTAGTENARPYYTAMRGDDPVAGIFTMHSPAFDGIGNHWFTYLSVADIQAGLAENEKQGGSLFREPFLIPNFGTLAIIKDNVGGFYGMIEPV